MNIKIKPAKVTCKIDAQRIYPKLEDLEITPSNEEQKYSGSYGNVKVHAVETEKLDITPTLEKQSYSGLYGEVNVKAIETENLNVAPTLEEQNFEGIYSNVVIEPIEKNEVTIIPATTGEVLEGIYTKINVEKIEGENLTITPSNIEQVKEGLYSKVTVTGDSNLIAENIKKDVTIFGVTGTAEGGSSSGGSEYNAKIVNPGGTSGAGDYIYRWLREISELDLTGVTSTASMFSGLSALNLLPNSLNTNSVTIMTSMFNSCTSLVKIPSMDTSKVTNMQTMFSNCNSITTIPELNAGKVTNIKTVFGTSTSTSKVENLGGFLDLGKKYTYKSQNYSNYTLTLSNQISLTHNSLMNVINKLYDLNVSYNVASGGTLYPQQLVLGSTNLAKLTADEIAIATSKGWNVS